MREAGGVHHEIDGVARDNEIDGDWKKSENDAREDRRIGAIRRRHQMRQPGAIDAEDGVEIAIHGVLDARRIPCGSRPEPHPSGAADECPDRDHRHPQTDKASAESPDGESSLPISVVAVAERICVDIGNGHQAYDDQRGHDHAGNPGIEIDQHLLQAQEIPRGFGGIHGHVGIGRLFERRIKRERPSHQ